jgi:DNA-binding GntR family transcriptional regulator
MDAPVSPSARRPFGQLCEEIEERIVTGAYPPGTRLDEQELAKAFCVSRTPIREALIQLASIGLIEIRPRRGATVPKVGADRVCEMFEVMAELEAMCARLAARRITPIEQHALQEAHNACQPALDANTPDIYYQLNEVFHQRIYQASHNSFLIEQTEALQRRLRPYRRLQLRVRNRMASSFDEHHAIVSAICTGNSELASELIRAHVMVQGERFTDLVANIRFMNSGASA